MCDICYILYCVYYYFFPTSSLVQYLICILLWYDCVAIVFAYQDALVVVENMLETLQSRPEEYVPLDSPGAPRPQELESASSAAAAIP